jgi:hypothetical protein
MRVFFDSQSELHLLDGEGIADDVLSQTLQVFALIRQDAATAMHVEIFYRLE